MSDAEKADPAYVQLFGYEDYNADVAFYADGSLWACTEYGDAPSMMTPEKALELAHTLTNWSRKMLEVEDE